MALSVRADGMQQCNGQARSKAPLLLDWLQPRGFPIFSVDDYRGKGIARNLQFSLPHTQIPPQILPFLKLYTLLPNIHQSTIPSTTINHLLTLSQDNNCYASVLHSKYPTGFMRSGLKSKQSPQDSISRAYAHNTLHRHQYYSTRSIGLADTFAITIFLARLSS